MFTLSIIVFIIMLIASVLHFYWALGGKYGLMSAGPNLENGKDFVPSSWLIFIVASLLFGLAILPLQLVAPMEQFKGYVHYVGYCVSLVLVVRAIGDFKYVGFFKKVYNSNFATLDTKYFSPLILFLGVSYGLLSGAST
ncbi:MAG: DUF3995 domain-containing protein [Colwelliaceae bacterium]|jgi:hypothetical protein|nr:DUF3995 domain-containing protein [Colwelliaceae bacterium]